MQPCLVKPSQVYNQYVCWSAGQIHAGKVTTSKGFHFSPLELGKENFQSWDQCPTNGVKVQPPNFSALKREKADLYEVIWMVLGQPGVSLGRDPVGKRERETGRERGGHVEF